MQTTVTIGTNDKYRFVIEGTVDHDYSDDDCTCGPRGACDRCDGHKFDDHDHAHAAVVYTGALRREDEPPEGEIKNIPVSWRDFSVASDPDLVSKIATYFDGVESSDPADLIRSKLRLIPCEIYANAQIAAQAELRPGRTDRPS